MFSELLLRDRGEGCATGQPQGVGSEGYLNSTSQGPTSEDARKDLVIRGRSKQFMKYPARLGVPEKIAPSPEVLQGLPSIQFFDRVFPSE